MAEDGFAVTVYREGGAWQCAELPPAVIADLDVCVGALRQQPPEGGPLALVDVADEFFVAVRLVPGASPPGDLRLLLSDMTAAVDWDLAAAVLDRLGEVAPDPEELDDVWPAGDLRIFSDLGLDERELGAILDDVDLWADEMLVMIANRIGIGPAFSRIVDTLPR